MKTKTYKADVELKPSKREVIAIISTDSVDADQEVLLPEGLTKKNYAGHPVCWAHDQKTPAIGSVRWVKVDDSPLVPGRKVVKACYFLHGKTELSEQVWQLLNTMADDGLPIIRSHSVGATYNQADRPTSDQLKTRPDWASANLVVSSWDMHEFSVCNVPANDDCIAIAVNKGIKILGEPKPKPAQPDNDKARWVWTPDYEKPTVVETIPMPTYARHIDPHEEITKALEARLQSQSIIDRIRGKVSH
jgi:hypothetical protein